jgi:hypothetical protein
VAAGADEGADDGLATGTGDVTGKGEATGPGEDTGSVDGRDETIGAGDGFDEATGDAGTPGTPGTADAIAVGGGAGAGDWAPPLHADRTFAATTAHRIFVRRRLTPTSSRQEYARVPLAARREPLPARRRMGRHDPRLVARSVHR